MRVLEAAGLVESASSFGQLDPTRYSLTDKGTIIARPGEPVFLYPRLAEGWTAPILEEHSAAEAEEAEKEGSYEASGAHVVRPLPAGRASDSPLDLRRRVPPTSQPDLARDWWCSGMRTWECQESIRVTSVGIDVPPENRPPRSLETVVKSGSRSGLRGKSKYKQPSRARRRLRGES